MNEPEKLILFPCDLNLLEVIICFMRSDSFENIDYIN